MATITSTIKLNDEMSGALRSILTQLEATEQQTEEVRKEVEKMPKSIAAWDVAMGNMLTGLIGKVGSFFSSAVSMGINFNKSMENYTTNFTTMLGGSVDAAKQKVAELQEFAAKTPFAMEELAQGTQTLLAFGVESEYTTSVLRMLGDVALGNKEKFQSLSLVFGQVMSQGKLMGGDLLQMINAGFNPLQVIAEQTGKSISELKDEMSKGAISAQMVAEAFKIATSEGGQFYQGMESASQTLDGLISTLQDNVAATLGTLFEPFTIGLKDMVEGAITFLEFLQPMIQMFANFVIEHMEAIKVVLLIVGAVAVGFAIKWAIAWAIANAQTLLAIGGIILIVVGVIKIINYFGLTVDDVLGFVSGAFMVAFAFINNVILGFGNFVLSIVNFVANGFINFANFLANIFVNPISSIIKMFEGMANNILGVLGGIAKALDAIFGSNLAGVVSGWQSNVTSAANALIQKVAPNEQYKEAFKPLELSMEQFGMQRMEYGGSWQKGKAFGSDLSGNLQGLLSDLTGAGQPQVGGMGDLASIDDMIKGMGGSDIDKLSKEMTGVGKGVKGVNDKLSGKGSLKSVGETKITDENLKYLMDIATVKYQRGYQASSPQINVNVSTGDINNGMDANRLFSQFENIIVDAVSNNLTRS